MFEMNWFFWLLVLLAVFFVVWQFLRMVKDRGLRKETKLILVILFVVASVVTAFAYWIYKMK